MDNFDETEILDKCQEELALEKQSHDAEIRRIADACGFEEYDAPHD